MNMELYYRYERLADAGRRQESGKVLSAFIASLASDDERRSFSRTFLQQQFDRDQIRHELYEEVIFPVLLEGFRQRDAWALLWLAKTRINLLRATRLWDQIDRTAPADLLRQAYAARPEDEAIREELLAFLMEGFHTCLHEWPSAILTAQGAAEAEDCVELLEEVELARRLDPEQRHAEFLHEVEEKVKQYQRRLD